MDCHLFDWDVNKRGGDAVQASTAPIPQSDQVLFCVVPKQAVRSKVADLKILHGTAALAAPTVAP
jgi:hypothetical protein